MARPSPARESTASASTGWRIAQVAIVLSLVGLFAWLASNTAQNLHSRGIMVGFDFLWRGARFPIAESLLPYDPTDSFGWAFVVGLGNTLYITLLVIVLSTALGVVVGVARRSSHPFASGLSAVFVDTCRNMPIVVQLLFWYAVVAFGLPDTDHASHPLPGVWFTDRGLYFPRLHLDGPLLPGVFVLVVGLGWAWTVRRRDQRRRTETGRSPHAGRKIVAGTLVAAVLVAATTGLRPSLEYATLGRFNYMGGVTLTPEFVAILVGLTVYSTAFAAEIIRGGLDAVPRGQWEAARAIGLSEHQTLRLIVLPQAMRLIIPPMTSQYINIMKNSTLALVVGYPELNFITATTINQTGQALEGVGILMAIFLAISLGASWLMNLYNQKLGLVTR
ncbi:ABC transporter permease [Novosphingobium indicum]|uniref:ABC transporter permease n=1 Tax=Novosphingobium indicum TaxID=462949 RepID=A0ABQ2K098_9SPHN|nr:ABC transporter permease subunit [Novosphingobium indicum]GGN61543.1 ABC transporter permease [Novosphingobium indicum]